MIKIFTCLIFSVLFFSCKSGEEPPSNIIEAQKMKSILWDMMQAQTLANQIAEKDSTINAASETKKLSQQVFLIHKTDSVHFNESYNWYIKHPDALKLIFDSLYVQKERENDLRIKKERSNPPLKKKIISNE